MGLTVTRGFDHRIDKKTGFTGMDSDLLILIILSSCKPKNVNGAWFSGADGLPRNDFGWFAL
jgi:hypothetical protein